jgi:hypothetical protein
MPFIRKKTSALCECARELEFAGTLAKSARFTRATFYTKKFISNDCGQFFGLEQ